MRERAAHVQRVDKILQDANLKLGSVVTDIMGQSGRAVLAAIVAGQTDPAKLVQLVGKRVKASRQPIADALHGRVSANHRFLLRLHLGQADALQAAIDEIDREVGERLDSFRVGAERLIQIPGVSDVVAAAIVSEIGVDMSRLPTSAHLISWAGLCPKNHASAGKRRSTRLRQGAPWLRTLLVQSAWRATRAKDTHLQAQFLRLRARRGPKKAIMAVAASILTAVNHVLNRHMDYRDLGTNHFSGLDKTKSVNRLLRRIETLGFEVTGIRQEQSA